MEVNVKEEGNVLQTFILSFFTFIKLKAKTGINYYLNKNIQNTP